MGDTLKTWWLTNGVVVEIIDESVQTSTDSWTIKLAVKGTIEIKTTYLDDFQDNPDYLEILSMLLPKAQYNRDIVKTGVKTVNVTAEKAFLLDVFARDALFYFEREDFPERYVRMLYKGIEKEMSAKRAINKKDSDEFL
jgi:hypothetical protein